MTISFPHGLPPDVVHQLLFSFHHYEVKYANSTQLMLAMPNAGGDRQLGNLLLLRDLAGAYPFALPTVRPACSGQQSPLRPLPAEFAAVATAGDGQ